MLRQQNDLLREESHGEKLAKVQVKSLTEEINFLKLYNSNEINDYKAENKMLKELVKCKAKDSVIRQSGENEGLCPREIAYTVISEEDEMSKELRFM